MNPPVPLPEPGWGWRSHASAWWWLGLAYRKPLQLRRALEHLPRRTGLGAGVKILALAMPLMLFIAMAGQLALQWAFNRHAAWDGTYLFSQIWPALYKLAVGIVGGAVFGAVFGAAFGVAVGIARGAVDGAAVGIAVGIVFSIAVGIAILFANIFAVASTIMFDAPSLGAVVFGTIIAFAGALAFGIAVGMTSKIADDTVDGKFDGVAFGITVGATIGIVFGIFGGATLGAITGIAGAIAILRAYYLPVCWVIFWPQASRYRYQLHPVAWDDLCMVSFPRFEHLLLGYAEVNRPAANAEINRLIDNYPSQRETARRALAALILRDSVKQTDLARLTSFLAPLPEGKRGWQSETPLFQDKVNGISRKAAELAAVDRPIFRQPVAEQLVLLIENFQHQLAGFSDPLRSEGRKAAAGWLNLARSRLAEVQQLVDREPTPQVFKAEGAVDARRGAFLRREMILDELEQQLMVANGCPGILLYGRRRTGKSTLLHYLPDYLPAHTGVAMMSMQEARAFASLADFCKSLASTIRTIWNGPGCPDENPSTLIDLERFLGQCNETLLQRNRRVILALDEYENLDVKIGEGVFSEDLLAVIRTSIQTHRQLIWLLAGSHHIAELTNAEWSSYLVSARTVEMPLFTPEETRLLLCEPVRHASLWSKGDPKRPRFTSAFWGEDGIERIHHEAGGWPHLVQLLAETSVDFLNLRGASILTTELLDETIEKAVVRGDTALRVLVERECTVAGEWDYLRGFLESDHLSAPNDAAIARSLRRRLLVVENKNQWQLRAPLMQRWLRKQG